MKVNYIFYRFISKGWIEYWNVVLKKVERIGKIEECLLFKVFVRIVFRGRLLFKFIIYIFFLINDK